MMMRGENPSELPRYLREVLEAAERGEVQSGPLRPSAADRAEYARLVENLGAERDANAYLRPLGLSPEDLQGKTVLDLGAGSRRLGASLQRQGVEARIIELDPSESGKLEMRVSGVGQALPLHGEAFDLVLASHSVPQWIFGGRGKELSGDERVPKEDEEFFASEMKKIFDECGRVLKPGGKALFSPNEVYYGERMQSHLLQQRGPQKLSPAQHWQVMEALQEHLQYDPTRAYEVFAEAHGRGGLITLVKQRDLARPKGKGAPPPDTRREER